MILWFSTSKCKIDPEHIFVIFHNDNTLLLKPGVTQQQPADAQVLLFLIFYQVQKKFQVENYKILYCLLLSQQ